MSIVISGVNNNDKITASDGTIDLLSGVTYGSEITVPSLKLGNNIQLGNAGIITATTFAGNISGTTGTFGDFVDVGSNIQLGNAGVATATTFVGNLTGNVNNTGNLLFQIGGSEKVRINSNGQLGIGVNPTHTLEILSGADHQNIVMVRGTDATTEYAGMGVYNGYAVFTGGGVGSTNAGIIFRTAATGNETERLRITSAGAVMINKSTSFGTVPLQVKGTSSGLGDGSQIFDIATTDGSTGTRLAFGVNEDNFGWIRSYESGVGGRDIVLAASDEKMRIKSDGKIGIGITNPQKNLHLYSSGVVSLRIETSDSRGQAWDILSTNGAQNNTGTLSFRDESGSAYLEFGANEGSPQFRVRNGGANDLLHIDNSGRVKSPYQPSFYATANSGGTISMTSTHILTNWRLSTSGKTYDIGSNFNTSNGRFTAPVSGIYLFTASILLAGYDQANSIHVMWRKNGSTFQYWYNTRTSDIDRSGYGGYLAQGSTTTMSLSANDYIDIACDFGGSLSVWAGDQNWGHFSGHLLG